MNLVNMMLNKKSRTQSWDIVWFHLQECPTCIWMSNCQRWVHQRQCLLAPSGERACMLSFFNIVLCPTKPSSIPKLPSFWLWRSSHTEPWLLLSQLGPAWPLLSSTSGPSSLPEERGCAHVWGDFLCSVSNKKHDLTFLCRSKKKTRKDTILLTIKKCL